MPKFILYEVHEEIVYRKWRYEIEADTRHEAIAKAAEGGETAHDCGVMGDIGQGFSGWAARRADREHSAADAWEAAASK